MKINKAKRTLVEQLTFSVRLTPNDIVEMVRDRLANEDADARNSFLDTPDDEIKVNLAQNCSLFFGSEIRCRRELVRRTALVPGHH